MRRVGHVATPQITQSRPQMPQLSTLNKPPTLIESDKTSSDRPPLSRFLFETARPKDAHEVAGHMIRLQDGRTFCAKALEKRLAVLTGR